jgi:hypothetical protein
MRIRAALAAICLVSLPSLLSCGKAMEAIGPASQVSCPAGIAEVGIGDGYFQTLCGCDEPAGRFFGASTTLTCTVPLNTTVIFYFLASHGVHQIRSVGTPDFPASPISDPGQSELAVRAHAIRPVATGIYRFQDITNHTASGQVIIR